MQVEKKCFSIPEDFGDLKAVHGDVLVTQKDAQLRFWRLVSDRLAVFRTLPLDNNTRLFIFRSTGAEFLLSGQKTLRVYQIFGDCKVLQRTGPHTDVVALSSTDSPLCWAVLGKSSIDLLDEQLKTRCSIEIPEDPPVVWLKTPSYLDKLYWHADGNRLDLFICRPSTTSVTVSQFTYDLQTQQVLSRTFSFRHRSHFPRSANVLFFYNRGSRTLWDSRNARFEIQPRQNQLDRPELQCLNEQFVAWERDLWLYDSLASDAPFSLHSKCSDFILDQSDPRTVWVVRTQIMRRPTYTRIRLRFPSLVELAAEAHAKYLHRQLEEKNQGALDHFYGALKRLMPAEFEIVKRRKTE
jgi:hypothetical protein